MKRILCIVIVISLIIFPCLAIQTTKLPGDSILGTWQTEVQDAKIQVYRIGNVYYGKIIWLEHKDVPQNVPWLDSRNPNPTLRNRTRENIVAMTGMVYSGDNKYSNGNIYYPTNGKTYCCCATLVDYNSLNIRPYMGVRLLGYNVKFTRVK